jgi:hypothetical protein
MSKSMLWSTAIAVLLTAALIVWQAIQGGLSEDPARTVGYDLGVGLFVLGILRVGYLVVKRPWRRK